MVNLLVFRFRLDMQKKLHFKGKMSMPLCNKLIIVTFNIYCDLYCISAAKSIVHTHNALIS